MVRHSDYRSIEILVLQEFAYIGLSLRPLACNGLNLLAAPLKRIAVAIAHIHHLAARHLGEALGKGAAAGVYSYHTQTDAVIGSQYRPFGGNGKTRDSAGQRQRSRSKGGSL